jgi:glutaminase
MSSLPTPFVSSGKLPSGEFVQQSIEEAHRRYRGSREGETSRVYPALARVDPDQFGICVVGVSGNAYSVGDCDVEFTIMSVSKPLVFALICELIGVEEARAKLGANATGYPFNSLVGFERQPNGITNPMVNSGAIATTSLIPGGTHAEKWKFLHDGLSRFAGRELPVNGEILECALDTNFRNRGIARILQSYGSIYSDPDEAVDLYTRQCSLNVTARDLAVMAATLADGGLNPVTKQQVVDASVCHHVLAVMATAGFYETSGDWLYDIGLPGKSGIGGGILAVSPGKGGLGTYSPRLDAAGNSVKGQLAAKFLSQQLGMDLFASKSHP